MIVLGHDIVFRQPLLEVGLRLFVMLNLNPVYIMVINQHLYWYHCLVLSRLVMVVPTIAALRETDFFRAVGCHSALNSRNN